MQDKVLHISSEPTMWKSVLVTLPLSNIDDNNLIHFSNKALKVPSRGRH